MPVLLVDAGVLIAAGRNETKAWALKSRARARRIPIVVITPVLAQAWRGRRDVNMARFLKGCAVEPLSEEVARRGGELCGQAGTDDAIDACLVAQAALRGDTIVTGDPGDIRALASLVFGVAVVEL